MHCFDRLALGTATGVLAHAFSMHAEGVMSADIGLSHEILQLIDARKLSRQDGNS